MFGWGDRKAARLAEVEESAEQLRAEVKRLAGRVDDLDAALTKLRWRVGKLGMPPQEAHGEPGRVAPPGDAGPAVDPISAAILARRKGGRGPANGTGLDEE